MIPPDITMKEKKQVPLYWLVYRHHNQISVVIEPALASA